MISSGKVIQALAEAGVNPNVIVLADANYSLPSERWLTGKFRQTLEDLQGWMRVQVYKDEANDCDDFAKLAAGLASACHNRGRAETGLAFGTFWYQSIRVGGYHAINVALVKRGKRVVPFFFEPQLLGIPEETLELKEIESCTLALL